MVRKVRSIDGAFVGAVLPQFVVEMERAAHVRVRNAVRDADFLAEAEQHLGVRGDFWPQRFECDLYAQHGVVRFIDAAHSSVSKGTHNFEPA